MNFRKEDLRGRSFFFQEGKTRTSIGGEKKDSGEDLFVLEVGVLVEIFQMKKIGIISCTKNSS